MTFITTDNERITIEGNSGSLMELAVENNVKLRMVGLSTGYNELLIRREKEKENRFSVWYSKDEKLLAVDAINNGKAYVLGSKFIKGGQIINKLNLIHSTTEFKLANLLAE